MVMDTKKAWAIVREYSSVECFSEEQMFLFEEALNYIIQDAMKYIKYGDLWRADIEAGAYNLADYYETIGKYELAIKYYKLSMEYGCNAASERIKKIRGYWV